MTEPTTLLLIPGWGASLHAWDAVAAGLPGLRIRVVSWADCLRDWPAALNNALPPQPCLLGGWSLGAMLALRAAIELPARVAGLVLVAGTARFLADGGYAGAEARALRAMRVRLSKDAPRVLGDFAKQCFLPEPDGGFEPRYAAEAAQCSPADLLAGLEALSTLDLRPRLGGVTCSSLIVHGSADQVVPLAAAHYLAAHLGDSHLRVLEGRGHALPFTAAGQIAAAIEDFVHEHNAHE